MKLSGYVYIKNVTEMKYPYKECIRSMLDTCDEVVVLDCSVVENEEQKDDLSDLLQTYGPEHLVIMDITDQAKNIWNVPNFGIWDGKMKALARSYCTGDYLLQMDSDEILEENARPKIDNLINQINGLNPPAPPLVACPVVEYWSSNGKVRIDVNPWKWRISKNDPNITHGIPAHLRNVENGLLYARHGTDGCNYIYSDTGAEVPCANFMNNDLETLRRGAILNSDAAKTYEQWFNIVVGELPTIYHFSWWNIERKIDNYGQFWNKFWNSLYNEKNNEQWNPFFPEKDFKDITQEEKLALVKRLAEECGGHIFHTKWTGLKTNHVNIHRSLPKYIVDWCEEMKERV